MKKRFDLRSSWSFLVTLLVLGFGGGADAASLKLVFTNGVSSGTNTACTTNTTSCLYRNVVYDQTTSAALAANNPYQRDAIVTLVGNPSNASLGAFDDDTAATTGNNQQFFSPIINRFGQANSAAQKDGYARFRFTFYAAGTTGLTIPSTTKALDGGVFISALDVDGNPPGNATSLNEFITLFDPDGETAGSDLTSLVPSIPTTGTKTYRNTSGTVGNGISSSNVFKVSIFEDSPVSFDYAIGSTYTGSAAGQICNTTGSTCNRLGAVSFDNFDALPLVALVEGYKSVKLTTDADGSGLSAVTAGDTLTYTITYVNTGNANVTNFQITDNLPNNVTFTVTDQTTGNQITGNQTVTAGTGSTATKNANYAGTGNLLAASATLAANSTITVTIPVVVGVGAVNTILSNQASASGTAAAGTNPSGVLTNRVDNVTVFAPSVRAAAGWPGVPALSVAQTVSTVPNPTTVAVVNASADLAITKTDNIASVLTGTNTTYTIRATNSGPSRVTGAVVKDPAATGLNQTAVACTSASGNTCTTVLTNAALQSASGVSLPALASGAFYEFTVTATVTAASGSVINTASVAVPSGTADPVSSNNSASDTDTVIPLPTLSISKTSNGPWVANQAGAAYTLTVSNAGPGVTSGVITVQDQLPVGITPRSISGFTSGNFTCTYLDELATGSPLADQTRTMTCTSSATIPSGGTSAITLPVEVNPNAVGSAVNYASVGGGGDPRNGGAAPPPGATCTPIGLCTSNTVTVTDVAPPPVCTTPAQTTNLLSAVFNNYDSVNGQNTTRDVPLIANSASYVSRGSGAGKAYVVDMSWGWNNGTGNALSPKATISLLINGTVYATMTTNDGYSGYATFAAFNGATIAGSETGRSAGFNAAPRAYVTLPTSVTAISSAQVRWVLGTNTSSDDDGGVIIRSINACDQSPVITLLKLGRNVSTSPAQPFIGSSGSIGAKPGDTVEYCIVYTNTGGAASNFKLTDNVPAGMNALTDGYAANRGVRWADGTVIATGATATPAGSDLTSITTDNDKGSLTSTGGLGKGVMTLDLGPAGLAAGGKGTVCFRAQVP